MTTEDHCVSVVIPNYNNARYIVQAIESVYIQRFRIFECIVVDDGSTDNSIALLDSLTKKYSSLKVLQQVNGGPSKARNKGWMEAKGDLVAFLDADDLWKIDKLEKQVKLMQAENADVVTSQYVWFDGKNKILNPQINREPIIPFDFWFDTYFSPSGVLLKKEVLISVGGWDEELWGCEDMDLWFRCALSGYKFSIVNSNDVLIRSHANNSKGNYLKMYQNHLLSLNKWVELIKDIKLSKKDTKLYINAVRKKLSKMRYYATILEDRKAIKQTFYFGIRCVGFRFLFDKLTLRQLYRSFSSNLKI
ncbi:glycosyltransferase family A protein [Pontibacter sp. 13R65]|uniref:glycosyltransferase family 2 protein n=1 Tax=Pontibacter sp. 13R65 TaxID=3127458 RepID=UPI00301CE1BB